MVGTPPSELAAKAMNVSANTLILVLSESENIAKRIENYLRNAGHPVRALWTTHIHDLDSLFKKNPLSLLLCMDGLPEAPFKEVLAVCGKLNKELPVLLLSARYAPENTLMALDAGAHDQVSFEDPTYLRHLEQVCLRELAAYQNFHALQQTRVQTAEAESIARKLLSESTDAVASVAEGIITEVNPAFVQLLKHKNAADLEGLPLMDLIAPEAQPRIKEHLKLLSKGKADSKAQECGLQKTDGSILATTISFTLSGTNGESIVQLLIKPLKNAAAPEVTGGRIPFMKRLKAATSQAAKQPRAAALIAVDNFASLESRLGFSDSEEAILKLMDWIKTHLTASEQMVRVSSDELALIVERPKVNDIGQLFEMLCANIPKEVFATRNHEAHLTVSISVYPFTGGEKADDIVSDLSREARALSTSGGSKTTMLGSTAKSAEAAKQEEQQVVLIKKAIAENRLRLAFQAISSLEGDPRQHLETLLRLMDEQGKDIAAAQFIGIAEKYGLTRTLDKWVTAAILRTIARRTSANENSTYFVKISEETLKDADEYVAWLANACKTRPLKPDELIFSFQERRIENHIGKAKALAKALRALGAGICIEHFGKGANSIQLMDHIPANFIKLDASFTLDFNNPEVNKVMASLMDEAKRRKIKSIVCHVEDANVMARLWQMGVNFVQGYLVQEPILSSGDTTG